MEITLAEWALDPSVVEAGMMKKGEELDWDDLAYLSSSISPLNHYQQPHSIRDCSISATLFESFLGIGIVNGKPNLKQGFIIVVVSSPHDNSHCSSESKYCVHQVVALDTQLN